MWWPCHAQRHILLLKEVYFRQTSQMKTEWLCSSRDVEDQRFCRAFESEVAAGSKCAVLSMQQEYQPGWDILRKKGDSGKYGSRRSQGRAGRYINRGRTSELCSNRNGEP